jgi:hypothetical protein
MNTNSKLVSLAALVAVALLGTSAHAQVIDLRFPNSGAGFRPGQAPSSFLPGSNRFGPGSRFAPPQRGIHPANHQDHRAFPDHGGSHAPGFPGGGWPTPGIAPPFPGTGPGLGGGQCAPGVSPAIGAVDALIGQVGAFLQVFGPTVGCVPQGEQIYRDALTLYESAVAFRQAAMAGAPPCDLKPIYAAMDRSCDRLVSRVNCVARGRSGPNIEQVRLIGALCQQIRAYL